MENLSNAWQAPDGHLISPTYAAFRNLASVKHSLRGIVQEMRTLRVSYRDAVREFQRRYITGVLITHACHLGRTAQELGMHRNTLARTIAELKIDITQIRDILRSSPVGNSRQTGALRME